MTLDECATVLAKCAAYDRRTVGRADVMAWHEVLGDIEYTDALAAVAAHYAQTNEWVMPADIRQRARVVRDERRRLERRAEPLALPSAFEDDPDRDARIERGLKAAQEVLPVESDSERAHRLAVKRARAENGKPLRPERKAARKPRPDPPRVEEVADMATRYLRDGWTPAAVAEKFAIDKKWCERVARRLPNTPIGWCGECTYEGHMRKADAMSDPIPCPKCAHQDNTGEAS